MTTSEKARCETCYSNDACQTRESNGLQRFCQLDREKPIDDNTMTYDVACANRKRGQSVRWVGGGYGTGTPARYVLTETIR